MPHLHLHFGPLAPGFVVPAFLHHLPVRRTDHHRRFRHARISVAKGGKFGHQHLGTWLAESFRWIINIEISSVQSCLIHKNWGNIEFKVYDWSAPRNFAATVAAVIGHSIHANILRPSRVRYFKAKPSKFVFRGWKNEVQTFFVCDGMLKICKTLHCEHTPTFADEIHVWSHILAVKFSKNQDHWFVHLFLQRSIFTPYQAAHFFGTQAPRCQRRCRCLRRKDPGL